MTEKTATEALRLATEALARIAAHEAECARRWGTVRWGVGLLWATLMPVLFTILAKQFGWI